MLSIIPQTPLDKDAIGVFVKPNYSICYYKPWHLLVNSYSVASGVLSLG
jgi:hypothetical protein